jgi:hypothetical protein
LSRCCIYYGSVKMLRWKIRDNCGCCCRVIWNNGWWTSNKTDFAIHDIVEFVIGAHEWAGNTRNDIIWWNSRSARIWCLSCSAVTLTIWSIPIGINTISIETIPIEPSLLIFQITICIVVSNLCCLC